MQESSEWLEVYESLSSIYTEVWEKPLSHLDVILEREYFNIHNPKIKQEDIA